MQLMLTERFPDESLMVHYGEKLQDPEGFHEPRHWSDAEGPRHPGTPSASGQCVLLDGFHGSDSAPNRRGISCAPRCLAGLFRDGVDARRLRERASARRGERGSQRADLARDLRNEPPAMASRGNRSAYFDAASIYTANVDTTGVIILAALATELHGVTWSPGGMRLFLPWRPASATNYGPFARQ
jgi:hypothetical protein